LVSFQKSHQVASKHISCYGIFISLEETAEAVRVLEDQYLNSPERTDSLANMQVMNQNTFQLPSGYQEIWSSEPLGTEVEDRHVLDDGESAAVVYESQFTSPELHSPTYEQSVQSLDLQTSTGTQAMQCVDIVSSCALQEGNFMLSKTSVEQTLDTAPVSSPNNQTLNLQIETSNENFQVVEGIDSILVNFIHSNLPDIFMVPSQLHLPIIDHNYSLPNLQTGNLPTQYQNVPIASLQENTEADHVQYSGREYIATVNPTINSTLSRLSTPITHSQTPSGTQQNLTSNQETDEIHSTPSTSQHLPTDVSVLASTYYSKLSIYYVLTIIIL